MVSGFCRSCHPPPGSEIPAPSSIAWAMAWSSLAAASTAAFSATQISVLPSNAGAVSQNSSRFALSWPSVRGMSLFQRTRSSFSGLFLVVGKSEESERAEGEPLPLLPPAGLPTHPPILPLAQAQGGVYHSLVEVNQAIK